MIDEEMKIGYDDITIVPERITTIESRKECNPYDENGMLPIFASCMSSVVSMENVKDFNDAKINAVVPRSYSIPDRIRCLSDLNGTSNFVAFSLDEARAIFRKRKETVLSIIKAPLYAKIGRDFVLEPIRICIDLANGHMQCLLNLVKELKDEWGKDIVIMTGNIAEPRTYIDYENAGVDFCRITVGSGSVCFVEGTKITMADGSLCNIEDVDKGDCVKTKNGIHKISNVFTKNTSETVVINNDVECTPNHEFFVVKKDEISDSPTDEEIKEKGMWVKAEDLTDEYLLVKE